MENQLDQPAEPVKKKQIHKNYKPRKPNTKISAPRITKPEVEDICKLMAENRLTEREALLHLNIKEGHWRVWKHTQKNSQEFADLIEKIKAAKIVNMMQKVEDAGNGVNMKQPDWRANAWLLERVLDPERFGNQNKPAPAPQININMGLLDSTLDKIFSDRQQPKQIEDLNQNGTSDPSEG